MSYVELHCHSNYSFLDGGSHPEELVQRAVELEIPALALTDTGGVYGAVKFMRAAHRQGIKPIIGATLEVDGEPVSLLAKSLRGYSNLCRLVSAAHRGQPKGEARTDMATLASLSQDLFAFTHLPTSRADAVRRLHDVQAAVGRDSTFVEICNHLRPEDKWNSSCAAEVARMCRAALVATNDVHYHVRSRRPLHDVLTAIRLRSTLDGVRGRLHPNSERCLKSAREMKALLRDHRGALEQGAELADECQLNELDFKNVRFPGFPVPDGETPFSYLYQLCQQGAQARYHPITPAVARRLQHELDVIEKTRLAEFFLINWDLMRFARENGVPGQGRGSAADSIVAYVLGITRVDPIAHNLLFERFLHEEMTTTPDIDIDFSTAHREKVIQYIYEKYGWERTGMVCNVVTFKPRMAIRQVGKAMALPADLVDRLARSIDSWFAQDVNEDVLAEVPEHGLETVAWRQFLQICHQVLGFPRHLSIHVGGMLVTGEPLVDIVPVEPATMPGRVVVQFDKDDVEDLGLIKMDMLGLRTLSVVAECIELAEKATGEKLDLDRLPLDDPRVYETCSAADTVGIFQIESRAQMQTLPRTQPRTFNDLVVEVAIIRPGPIQGNAVHPYIRRRQGREPVTYAHPLLEPILRDTLGVILYQEQIIEIAMHVAGMRAADADRFRRAMTRHFSRIEMSSLESDFVAGCVNNEVPRRVAEDLFKAVEGFASFGFCRSHAAAFARTAYETAWLKLNFPAAYYCALLNNQPMGFYHPSVLVGDAKRHGVTVRAVDINASAERCLPETAEVFRVGLNYVRDLGEGGVRAIVDERAKNGSFRSFDDFLTRLPGAPINPRALTNLVMVGAFDAVDRPRRELLWRWQESWRGAGLRRRIERQANFGLSSEAPSLPPIDEMEATRLEYRVSDLSTGRHVVSFHRERLLALGAVDSRAAAEAPDGAAIRVAGLVITRQAPSTASGVRFFTLEDEFGHVNVTIKQDVYTRCRRVANSNPMLVVDGIVQRQDGVWSILAREISAVPGATREFSRSHDYK